MLWVSHFHMTKTHQTQGPLGNDHESHHQNPSIWCVICSQEIIFHISIFHPPKINNYQGGLVSCPSNNIYHNILYIILDTIYYKHKIYQILLNYILSTVDLQLIVWLPGLVSRPHHWLWSPPLVLLGVVGVIKVQEINLLITVTFSFDINCFLKIDIKRGLSTKTP